MVKNVSWIENKGFRQLARMELPGAGQVVVDGNYAYLANMKPPLGTTILDISDPKDPKIVSQIEIPLNVHSHKVNVSGDIMLVNHEKYRSYEGSEVSRGGLKIFDISNKANPREISFVEAGEWGYHRFTFDGRYCYGSPCPEGYEGNIVGILDLKNTEKPEYASMWWAPGQWVGGGEEPRPEGRRCRCHHPIRLGDRLYAGWWLDGWYILDISDLSKPEFVKHIKWQPPYARPTHTTLPIPFDIKGRKILLVSDEEARDQYAPVPNGFIWLVDITEETNPVPISTYRARKDDEPFDPDCWYGCHQPQEQIYGEQTHFAVTWFAGGLRMIDIADPWRVEELGYYIPEPGKGFDITQTNDVYQTPDGLYYITDRLGGFEILEWIG